MSEYPPEDNIEGGKEGQKDKKENTAESGDAMMSPEQYKLVNSYMETLQQRSLLSERLSDKQTERNSLQSQITADNTEEFSKRILEAETELQQLQKGIEELSNNIASTLNQITDENKKHLVIENPKSNKELRENILKEYGKSLESKENREFTLEDIRKVLTEMEGKEFLNLSIVDQKETIKGNLMYICFTNGEKEMIEGQEYEITYLLTLAGQRYLPDGSEGKVMSKTSLSKDYDGGMFRSDQLAEYINGKWIKGK